MLMSDFQCTTVAIGKCYPVPYVVQLIFHHMEGKEHDLITNALTKLRAVADVE